MDGLPRPRHARRTRTTTATSSSRSPACAPSAPRCWGSPPTRRSHRGSRPPGPRRPSQRSCSRLAAPAARNARSGAARARSDRRQPAGPFPSRPTTGRSTPRRSGTAELRRRHQRDAPVLRGGAGAAGRRVLRGDHALRHHVHRADRPRRRTTPTSVSSRSATRTASALGLYLLDLYTRDSKRGGAWMNSLVSPVAPARHRHRRRQQPERAEARRRASRPC